MPRTGRVPAYVQAVRPFCGKAFGLGHGPLDNVRAGFAQAIARKRVRRRVAGCP